MTGAQHTLRTTVSFDGIGLHSGRPVHMDVAPAAANHGIVFEVHGDGGQITHIPAHADLVALSSYATSLRVGTVTLHTVEHLLAALAGLGIDNARITLTGFEVPIMDGSATAFVAALEATGTEAQVALRNPVRITQPLSVRDGADRWIEIVPTVGNTLVVDYLVDFGDTVIGRQQLTYHHSPTAFTDELATARTFGFLRDAAALRQVGLAQGGSLENVVVIDDDGVMNPGGLRFPDEQVRHKILDLIGDLALVGRPVIGHIRAHRAGHDLHTRLGQAILAQAATATPAEMVPTAVAAVG